MDRIRFPPCYSRLKNDGKNKEKQRVEPLSDGRPTDRLEMHARAAGVGTPSFFWPALSLHLLLPPLLSANG